MSFDIVTIWQFDWHFDNLTIWLTFWHYQTDLIRSWLIWSDFNRSGQISTDLGRFDIVDIWHCWHLTLFKFDIVDIWHCWHLTLLTVDIWYCWHLTLLTLDIVDFRHYWLLTLLTKKYIVWDIWKRLLKIW